MPTLMHKSFWWWQCRDRYIISPPNPPPPPPPYPLPPFSPSLINLVVSVDVKHHVYCWSWKDCKASHAGKHQRAHSLISRSSARSSTKAYQTASEISQSMLESECCKIPKATPRNRESGTSPRQAKQRNQCRNASWQNSNKPKISESSQTDSGTLHSRFKITLLPHQRN